MSTNKKEEEWKTHLIGLLESRSHLELRISLLEKHCNENYKELLDKFDSLQQSNDTAKIEKKVEHLLEGIRMFEVCKQQRDIEIDREINMLKGATAAMLAATRSIGPQPAFIPPSIPPLQRIPFMVPNPSRMSPPRQPFMSNIIVDTTAYPKQPITPTVPTSSVSPDDIESNVATEIEIDKISTDHYYSLIGRSGEKINLIRDYSGADISFTEITDKKKQAHFEIKYRGTILQIRMAKDCIQNLVPSNTKPTDLQMDWAVAKNDDIIAKDGAIDLLKDQELKSIKTYPESCSSEQFEDILSEEDTDATSDEDKTKISLSITVTCSSKLKDCPCRFQNVETYEKGLMNTEFGLMIIENINKSLELPENSFTLKSCFKSQNEEWTYIILQIDENQGRNDFFQTKFESICNKAATEGYSYPKLIDPFPVRDHVISLTKFGNISLVRQNLRSKSPKQILVNVLQDIEDGKDVLKAFKRVCNKPAD